MATVSTYLKMMDQFSRPLERVSNQVNATIVRMERMQRLVERPARLNIDASKVQSQLAAVQKVVQNAHIDITFNARQAVKRAQMMRNMIQKQLNGIEARIKIELPVSLNVMFANLQRLVMRFIAATRRLQGVAGNQTSAQQQIVNLQQRILQLQNQINTKTRQAGQASSGWLNNLKGIAATYLSFQGLKTGITVSDDYINTLARLDLVNDKTRTTAELQDKIFAAAERARGSYTDMAGVIGRMGILAADAFTSNDELIAFSEMMQKSFRVGGSSTMEQQAGMYQLSQAMAAGKLQGDEFRSIMENAPMLADAIAKFTGKSKGELKEMSAEGAITADIIKGAIFMMADEINAKLEAMPKTFGDVFKRLKDHALKSFGPLIQRINGMLNSEKGKQIVASIQRGIDATAASLDRLLTASVNVYSFFSENWSMIAPLIMGITGAFVAWKTVTVAINTVMAIHNGIQALLAAKAAIATGATLAQTAAQWGLNTALLANPYTWVVIGIVALITAIVLLVKYVLKMWKTNDEFAAGLMRTWNSILNFFDQVPIFFTKVWHGIANGAEWMAVEVANILEGMINNSIDRINDFINTLNKLPFVNLETVDHVEFASKMASQAEANKQRRAEEVAEMESKAEEKAAKREQNVVDTMESRAAKRAKEAAEKEAEEDANAYEDTFDYKGAASAIDISHIDKVGEVGKIKDTVDISSEDLKTMRELAEMKNIQNFVTLQPQLSFGDTNIRQDGRSVDEIVANITERMEQELVASARGVYNV